MKSRLTTLLSLLLLVSAVFGLPATRGGGLRVTAAIVCELRERQDEERALPRLVPPAPPAVPGFPLDTPAGVLLDYSLFQRPPPAA
jgi:hypothetical protein